MPRTVHTGAGRDWRHGAAVVVPVPRVLPARGPHRPRTPGSQTWDQPSWRFGRGDRRPLAAQGCQDVAGAGRPDGRPVPAAGRRGRGAGRAGQPVADDRPGPGRHPGGVSRTSGSRSADAPGQPGAHGRPAGSRGRPASRDRAASAGRDVLRAHRVAGAVSRPVPPRGALARTRPGAHDTGGHRTRRFGLGQWRSRTAASALAATRGALRPTRAASRGAVPAGLMSSEGSRQTASQPTRVVLSALSRGLGVLKRGVTTATWKTRR